MSIALKQPTITGQILHAYLTDVALVSSSLHTESSLNLLWTMTEIISPVILFLDWNDALKIQEWFKENLTIFTILL